MSAAVVADSRARGAQAGEPVLQVKGLTVSFGGVQAVRDVTFDVAPESILGLIGPNGAGKTTVFDAISGLVRSSGQVILNGHEISNYSPERRSRARLGRSFQDARLFPSLTVTETLAVAFERHIHASDVVSTALRAPWVRRSERRVRARVDELIDLMGLGAFRDKFISELSTGSRRVVDLATTLAHDPAVLLLDEPSSGIAQREAEALAPLMHRIRQQTGASLLVVEHDMPLITSVADEILALETGQVLMRGRPQEVLDDPRVIASYLGTDASVVARSGATGRPKTAAAADEPTVQLARVARTRKTAGSKANGAGKTASRKAATPTKKASATAKKAAGPAKKAGATKKATEAKKTTAAKKAGTTKQSATKKSAATKKSVTTTKRAAAKKTTTAKGSAAKKAASGTEAAD